MDKDGVLYTFIAFHSRVKRENWSKNERVTQKSRKIHCFGSTTAFITENFLNEQKMGVTYISLVFHSRITRKNGVKN